MIDIRFIRENPGAIRKDLKRRGDRERLPWVDEILENDEKLRKLLKEAQELRHRRNTLSSDINSVKKKGLDAKKLLEEDKKIPCRIKEIEDECAALEADIKSKQMGLPNILHDSVPEGMENVTVREKGTKRKFDFEIVSHGEWLESRNLADFKRAAKISGSGFYFLKGEAALLEIAIERLAIDILMKKGFTIIQTPFMMRKTPYEGVTDLNDFKNVMYKIEEDDLYLIATSEHPIAAMHMGEIFDEKDLPIKYAGISSCFRKEIGSHGIDTRGLFRVHQFNKIEQFIFSKPEDSWKLHEEMIANAEEIFSALELPYRVVNICTGDIGTVAAKKYDIEIWMPREKEYKEAVSCSNCTAYQATRLNVKYRKGEEKEHVHTLNSTAIATSRAIRAIIENCQQKDGSVKIPKVLVPYMNGIKSI